MVKNNVLEVLRDLIKWKPNQIVSPYNSVDGQLDYTQDLLFTDKTQCDLPITYFMKSEIEQYSIVQYTII